MKIDEILTTEYCFNWLESQKWQWNEWFNSAFESIDVHELEKQSIILTSAIRDFLRNKSTKFEHNGYYYIFDSRFPTRISRTSDKIRKPSEKKLSYSVKKILPKVV